ncbi:MAG: 3-hydroxyacyl-CoA dehydrogenase/enoyl-CoA hydratase/3-hydroxybutyryl-CoA epimerase [Planctomycetota bacterium]|jgi:3-hydroxyacyl-CoA dehydrogenase/enoyl-CoA hydratase/3-hydroxybutyryl-CoA epimerase
MDLSGYPVPENAPEPGACLRVERPEAGLAIVTFDSPHRSFSVLDAPLLRDLDTLVTQFEGDPALRGIVFQGRSPDQFLAGADVQGIGQITDVSVIEGIVLSVHALFDRIAALKARTVAAVGGPVPGGALELSLACDRIIATDAKNTRIGLPETQLGILPGWGGSHRLPARIGLPHALDAILTGRLFPAKVALKRGMVDRLTKSEYLGRVARDVAMGRMPCKRHSRGSKLWTVDRNPIARAVIEHQALKGLDAKANGKYPAPYAALDLVMSSVKSPRKNWAGREARAISALLTGPVCKSLVSLFFGSEEAKKLGRLPDGGKAEMPEFATVVGAGVMGAGIAGSLAEKGVNVRLADLSSEALGRALGEHEKSVLRKVKRRRMTKSDGTAAIDRLDAAQGIVGMARSTFAVEAVAEVLGVKHKVFGELAEALPAGAILATNTSSLSVTEIAAGVPSPERVVGMHFFNPVRMMPLVEVVRGANTSDEVVARTCALAISMGKTPVITRDVPGFLVNRLLGPYIDEAVRLFVGGADAARIDSLMVDFGMPMGPLRLLDEVGLDIASHAAASLHAGYGDRMQPSDGISGLMGDERLGKKTGQGFYDHTSHGKRKSSAKLMADLPNFQQETWARSLRDDELVNRMVLAMVNEAYRCLEEGVVSSSAVLDLATVFGTGFAPFRGGVLRYAESVGLPEIVERLDHLAGQEEILERGPGAMRFRAAALLRQRAQDSGNLTAEDS